MLYKSIFWVKKEHKVQHFLVVEILFFLRFFKSKVHSLSLILNSNLNFITMKRCMFFLALLIGFQLQMTAQKSKSGKVAPKEDIRVNREYDENGNLIKFDSIYSYNWSGDTTLFESISPENLQNLIGDHFNFFNDSSFLGKSFFDDFDKSFFSPFGSKSDSILNQFRSFHFKNGSIDQNFMGLEDFFRQFNESKNDSILSKTPGMAPFQQQPKTMDEMMKMLQRQMKEIEKHQKEFFKEQPEWKEF